MSSLILFIATISPNMRLTRTRLPSISFRRSERSDADYAEYFLEDSEFREFCLGATTLIAHNITFELRHLGELVKFDKHFCTMKSNKKIVGALNIRGSLKNPKLLEMCRHYGIEFDEEQYHSAIYDVTKTLEVLNRMNVDL